MAACDVHVRAAAARVATQAPRPGPTRDHAFFKFGEHALFFEGTEGGMRGLAGGEGAVGGVRGGGGVDGGFGRYEVVGG